MSAATPALTVLLSGRAHQRFGDRLERAGGGRVRWLLLEPDGTVGPAPADLAPGGAAGSRRGDRAGTSHPAGAAEVAWLSHDLLAHGGVGTFFDTLEHAEALDWVQSFSAGVDSPRFERLASRGVRVATSHVTDTPIAEFTLRSVLDHYQRPERWRAAQHQQRWEHHEFREVRDTTWLVLGMGAIGTAVAERARAFGARVLGTRRHPTGNEPAEAVATPDATMDLVPEADVVVLALPADRSTRHVVDAGFLARMREGSLLVNVARGSLVDEQALLRALDRGVPEHAVLDVFETEPLPEASPLWLHPRVSVSPHNAAAGAGRSARAAEVFAENLRRHLAGEALLHEVAPRRDDA